MNNIYQFELPGFIILPRKTKKDYRVSLNLNVYRNLHYNVEAQAKKSFLPSPGYKRFRAEAIVVSYVIEKKSKRRFDTMNIVSIVDKYFLDWLVKEGFIADDNCTIVSYGSAEGYIGCAQDKITASVLVKKYIPEQNALFL